MHAEQQGMSNPSHIASLDGAASDCGIVPIEEMEEAGCRREAYAMAQEGAEAVAAAAAVDGAAATVVELPSPWTAGRLAWSVRQAPKEYAESSAAIQAWQRCQARS
jgi:hypothetical protein